MSEKKNPKALLTEEDWAYQVFDSFVEAFNRVASSKPEETDRLMNQLKIEFLKKMPDLFEALMILTKPEHRPVIYEFFKSFVAVIKRWSQSKKTLKNQ